MAKSEAEAVWSLINLIIDKLLVEKAKALAELFGDHDQSLNRLASQLRKAAWHQLERPHGGSGVAD